VEKQERLINGFTPIKDIIYCMQKLKILQMHNKMISLKLKVVGIKTDCVFYEGKNEIIQQNFDLTNSIGNFKIETGKYIADSKLFIKFPRSSSNFNWIEFILQLEKQLRIFS
jgi:hypothetical protein